MFFKKKQEKQNQEVVVELSNDFKSALRHFAYYYTNGTLPFVIGDESILKNVDYREILKEEASLVEQAYAIFANVIKMDSSGKVLNQTQAMKRAAQWIRHVCTHRIDNYMIEPEFEDWEVHLH
ncbi:DUF7677 family protein [Marinoscillum pacificum]|uniref:DUF7677 family protein n=1 Tax=Marinoscillum pacificum TaxID=392723 RepID=UPI0021571511|nr:hypothetical protein [Marinoscillum pacificum]